MRFPNLSFLSWNRSKVNATHSPDDDYEGDDYDMDAYGYDGYDGYDDATDGIGGPGAVTRALGSARDRLTGQASRKAKEERIEQLTSYRDLVDNSLKSKKEMNESEDRLRQRAGDTQRLSKLTTRHHDEANKAFATSSRKSGLTTQPLTARMRPHYHN